MVECFAEVCMTGTTFPLDPQPLVDREETPPVQTPPYMRSKMDAG